MARKDFESSAAWDWTQVYTGPASDDKGHKATLRIGFPEAWLAAMSMLASPGNEFPEYDSVAAFVRDAIFSRIQWASTQAGRSVDPRIKSLMSLEANTAHLHGMEQARRQVFAHLDLMDKVFRDALADGDQVGVRKAVHQFEESLDGFPQPYYDQVREKLDIWKRKALHS